MSTRAALLALAATAILGTKPAVAVDGLRTPSDNIVCTVQDSDDKLVGELRCDTRNFRLTKDRPPKNCHLGWGDAFSIGENGRSGERICQVIRSCTKPSWFCRTEIPGGTAPLGADRKRTA
jgi:hypothetical protein